MSAVHVWGACPDRLKTTATYPPSPMPHNCLARSCNGQGCSCAWCGAPAPASAEMIPSIHDRLLARVPAYIPKLEELVRLDAFFAAHPEADEVYYFYDGRVIEGAAYRARMTSRTAQLVAIATDGFPVNLHRSSYRRGVR